MTTVAIIGAGPLGRWLALAAARAGYRVLLEDVMPANLHHAQEYLRRQLGPAALAKADSHGSEAPVQSGTKAGSRISEVIGGSALGVEFVGTVEDAVREADLAIDCVPDELESKLEILWLIDRMAPPKTVIATPTRRLQIADLAACTYRAEKCVALDLDPRRFLESPEADSDGCMVIKTTERTASQTVEQVREFWENLGFRAKIESEPVAESGVRPGSDH